MVLSQRKRGFIHKYRKAITGVGRQCWKVVYQCTECHRLSGWVSTNSIVWEPDLLLLPWQVRGAAGSHQKLCSLRDTHVFLIGEGMLMITEPDCSMPRHFIVLAATRVGLPSLSSQPHLRYVAFILNLYNCAVQQSTHGSTHPQTTLRSPASQDTLSKEQALSPILWSTCQSSNPVIRSSAVSKGPQKKHCVSA